MRLVWTLIYLYIYLHSSNEENDTHTCGSSALDPPDTLSVFLGTDVGGCQGNVGASLELHLIGWTG